MVVTDSIIGFHYLIPAVYISFLLIVGIGLLLRRSNKVSWLVAGSIASSTLFFVITNFYEWYAGIMYPKTAEGLVTCIVAAIPFYFNSLIGDMFFVSLMFMSFEFLTRRFNVLVQA